MPTETLPMRPDRSIGSANVVDVARLARVSNATVSRVFSQAAKVNEQTRRRVIEAAKKLNYTPNPLARGLRGYLTHMIGIIWSQAAETSAPRFLYHLGTKLEARGYLTSLSEKTTFDAQIKALNDYARRRVDGVIAQLWVDEQLSPAAVDILRRFKAVLLVSQSPVDADFDQLVIDRTEAYRHVARHFAQTGRKKIAFFTDILLSNRRKYNAFREELLNQGVLFQNEGFIGGGADGKTCSLDELRQILDSRFADRFPFDAVMCTNDTNALLLMQWLAGKGYKIPDDVAIAGFDNTEICAHVNPPLASVDRRIQETVDEIDRMFFERLENPQMAPRTNWLSMTFVWRQSAGS